MNAFTVILAFAAIACCTASPYIINGDISAPGKWPWQISLQVRDGAGGWGHICGGSILDETTVLTAAHCTMNDGDPANYRVIVGIFQLSANQFAQEMKVATIHQHPGFSMDNKGIPDDLTVLKLNSKIILSHPEVSTIEMGDPNVRYAGNENCYITGFGRNDRSTNNPSDFLREANVPVLTNSVCAKKYGFWNRIMPLQDSHVCMGDPDKADIHACHGDSGGPLVCDISGTNDWHLVGVASRTGPPNCENYPSVYIRVSSYQDWISSFMDR